MPDGSRVYADPLDRTHDPEGGVWGLLYRRQSRDLAAYTNGASYNHGSLKIHRSVFERLAAVPVKFHESDWFAWEKYKHCFTGSVQGIVYQPSGNCPSLIEIVPSP